MMRLNAQQASNTFFWTEWPGCTEYMESFLVALMRLIAKRMIWIFFTVGLMSLKVQKTCNFHCWIDERDGIEDLESFTIGLKVGR